jgi:hypothetical protein
LASRGLTERIGLRPGDFNSVLEQLGRELVRDRAGRGVVVVPDRMRRDEAFGEGDHPRAVAAGFANQAAGFLGRAFAIEEHGRGLHRRNLHHPVVVTHPRLLPPAPASW